MMKFRIIETWEGKYRPQRLYFWLFWRTFRTQRSNVGGCWTEPSEYDTKVGALEDIISIVRDKIAAVRRENQMNAFRPVAPHNLAFDPDALADWDDAKIDAFFDELRAKVEPARGSGMVALSGGVDS